MMFHVSGRDRSVTRKNKMTFMYVQEFMQGSIREVRSFCMKSQLDQRRGRTRTFHGSRHFLEFSRSRVQFVSGRFAKEMRVLLFVRQAIGWMTNDEQLVRALADQCGNCGYGSGEWTRGASSAGGLGRNGAVFPATSCRICIEGHQPEGTRPKSRLGY